MYLNDLIKFLIKNNLFELTCFNVINFSLLFLVLIKKFILIVFFYIQTNKLVISMLVIHVWYRLQDFDLISCVQIIK